MNLILTSGNEDYSVVAGGDLTTTIDSTTTDGRACVSVSLLDDNILENAETFIAVLSSKNAQVSEDNQIEITINDDNGKNLRKSCMQANMYSYTCIAQAWFTIGNCMAECLCKMYCGILTL